MKGLIQQKIHPVSPEAKGFTLVITISLLFLLVLISVGLLSLSSVTLRTTIRGEAQSVARTNARMALLLALGELQKSVGPDRAITATAEILAKNSTVVSKPRTTGVWESWWDFNPSTAPDYDAQKTNRFRRWLVSSADTAAPLSRDFVTTAWTGKTIELVGKGSLGDNANADAKVTAGLVPVSKDGKVQGAYGWHVSDESVKARINLYRDPRLNTTLAQKRALLAGHRPDPSLIKGPDGSMLTSLPNDLSATEFTKAVASTAKVIDLEQAELLDQAKGKIKPLRNDITPYSLGVMTDVRRGGLKQDLSSVFEMGSASVNTLPAEFSGKKLYQSTHGITGISDPFWGAMAGYYNTFRSVSSAESSPRITMKAAPSLIDPVPAGYNPAPVIAKVDVILSVVARPLSNMAGWIRDPNGCGGTYDHMVTLIVTPVVTLHNPYNVNISFNQMKVVFSNIPVGFNFMFQDGSGGGAVSQSIVPGTFECYNTMAYRGHRNPATGELARNNKRFVLSIADWATDDPLASDSSILSPIYLRPGQTIVCGPTLPPNSSFDQDTKSGSNAVGFDWEGDLLDVIKAKPKFVPGLGFEVSAVTISSFRSSIYSTGSIPGKPNFFPGAWRGHPFTLLRDPSTDPKVSNSTTTDRFYLEYKIVRPYWYEDDTTVNPTKADPLFAVTAQIQATSSSTLQEFAKLQFDYRDESTLQNLFDNRVYRYPPTGSFSATQFAAPPGTPYSMQSSFVHPFAIFSAYTRTTNGGVYETGIRNKGPVDSPAVNLLKDGRLAGKPYLFHNPSRSNFTTDLATTKPGGHAYELNFQPFLSKGDFEGYMDVDVNRVPSLTGNKTSTGIKSGSYLEIPSGPLLSIADFRRSNALTTSYLPQFVQPVSNSLLHPLMSADKVIETNAGISSTALLDHSVLANHALYDRFYFSTFATRGTETPEVVFEKFMNGTTPLSLQGFQPILPSGKTVASAKTELFNSGKPRDGTYKTAAEFQMIRGPFNVNSTSVQAWKAVLGSMNKSDVYTLWSRNSVLETRKATGTPITSMSLINGGAIPSAGVVATKIDNAKTNNWNGYRELTEAELETLAVKIVEEVRERGPFLSLSEFVNRRVGTLGPLTLKGALEAAITKAEINEKENATSLNSFLNQVPITATDIADPKLYLYKTPAATTGNPAAGAPGWINQGDLLRILEPGATVRGDTFVIRTYGEAQDAFGNVTARAYAEAVVQRVPEYLDPSDRPSLNAATDTTAKPTNKAFGRRINVVSFRWLSPNEI
jgi:Tfp pilus assembly protein PilV